MSKDILSSKTGAEPVAIMLETCPDRISFKKDARRGHMSVYSVLFPFQSEYHQTLRSSASTHIHMTEPDGINAPIYASLRRNP